MELTRRVFLGAAALLLAPSLAAKRCVEAVRARIYPGPIRSLDAAEIKRPGKWAG